MTNSDKLYVVRLTNGSMITTIQADAALEMASRHEGSALSYRPFPSTVKMPYIDGKDVTYTDGLNGVSATYEPLGVSGHSDTRYDAYRVMLRAIREHLDSATETAVAAV